LCVFQSSVQSGLHLLSLFARSASSSKERTCFGGAAAGRSYGLLAETIEWG
jgi:hypothetical protein